MESDKIICSLEIDARDLTESGVSISDEKLEEFGEFLQDFAWNEIDIISLIQKAYQEYKSYR